MFGIERKVKKAARKGAAFSAAALLGLVGCGFLTVAAWLVLTEMRDDLFAASIIGMVYIAGAIIAAAVGMSSPSEAQEKQAAVQELKEELTPLQTVVLSFVQGFERGRQNKQL